MTEKQDCVIFDLDGTLFDISHRLHFIEHKGKQDWTAFYAACIDDTPKMDVVKAYQFYTGVMGLTAIIVSGRSEEVREHTKVCLHAAGIYYWGKLYMRPMLDFRKSTDLKRSCLHMIKKDWNPILAVDDNVLDVRMYIDNKVPCWLVG